MLAKAKSFRDVEVTIIKRRDVAERNVYLFACEEEDYRKLAEIARERKLRWLDEVRKCDDELQELLRGAT